LKKFQKIFGVFEKRRIAPRKGGKHHQLSNEKGGENVEPNSREFYKQCAFQKFCNTVLHNEACTSTFMVGSTVALAGIFLTGFPPFPDVLCINKLCFI